jgi:hypothetical protein
MTVAKGRESAKGRAERLHRSAETLEAASLALAGLVPTLQRLAEAENLRALARDYPAEITSGAVRALIAARRLRDDLVGPGIADPGWALLLEALAARLDGGRLGVTQLGNASELAPATMHRWIAKLTKRGLLVRRPDPARERAILIDLTDEAADRIRAYLTAALKFSPWVA